MIDLVLAVAVFSGSSPVPSSGSFPLPPPPPLESIASVAGSSSTPAVTPPPPPPPQTQQQEPPKESWADKMWKRYTQNKGAN